MNCTRIAQDTYQTGCNCAQSTLAPFCAAAGIPPELGIKVAANFGGGIARTYSTCGAITGMCMAAGLVYGTPEMTAGEARKALEEKTQALILAFRDQNGSTICKELLRIQPDGQRPADAPPQKEFCTGLVGCAAGLLEAQMRQDGLL